MNQEEYVVFIALTKGRAIEIIAGFDKTQAETALGVLSQSYPRRIECAQGIAKCIKTLQDHNRLFLKDRKKASINVSLQTPGGLFVRPTVGLYWRAAKLVAVACLMKNEAGLQLLKNDLMRIMSGSVPPKTILKPFLVSEGFQPKNGTFF